MLLNSEHQESWDNTVFRTILFFAKKHHLQYINASFLNYLYFKAFV